MSEELRQDDIDALLNQQEGEAGQEEAKEEEKTETQGAQEAESLGDAEADLLAQWEEALKEAKEAEAAQKAEDEPSKKKEEKSAPQAETPRFEEFTAKGGSAEGHPSLDFILDIPLEISVEIGRSKMIINDLLKLSQGSIIELNKLAGEPAEIYVNQRLMARGEVVVVNDRFAVRLTEIISPQERIRQLGS